MSAQSETLIVRAPAKVNLNLHILGKRSDGYHDLDTVMQKLDLADILTLRRLEHPGIQLACPDSDLPEDDSNLIWQAAAAYLEKTGLEKECGVSVILEKRIPIAAGLGGGSSDAGAVLTGLNQLFKKRLEENELLSIGAVLGADVPFFIVPYAAVHATGIGDRMTPHDALDKCSLLLVNPGFSVSTAWVYKNFTLTRPDKDSNLSDSRENESLSGGARPLYNDLETVTIVHYPELRDIKRFMNDCGASGTLMSGSGPTVFGVFPDQESNNNSGLQECAEKLTEKYGRGVFITRPVC
ncbi:MAG TPA: 4-(cytidine 5'-diphospho)-2-C-methyl-D-erythritol kinase [Desulfobacterales bacterium]|nr:4-(cytidine 5'-diphospho)-2-C-methyl-D-erythritol kinase [Desulfobacterales bacterium]HIP40498.1 4-(cytidine 5'-diphospho)-2-C-methyl-D-erythritol kinase [Desulfocapsa sulfexigens]